MAMKALRDSPEVREAARMLLNVSERALSFAQRANERAITHVRLRVRAWQLALDPETKPWIAAAKQSLADGTAQEQALGSEEITRRLQEARRDLRA